ncbi:MAG: DUF1294 domain-containing protein [Anaerolineae bacterium]
MRAASFSTLVALAIIVALQILLFVDLQLPFYAAWLVGVSLTTLVFYWVDKRLARIRRFTIRIPERTLNLLALAGGFAGAWLGRGLFHHKTNIRKHWEMFAILVLSTLIHTALIYWVFFRDLWPLW